MRAIVLALAVVCAAVAVATAEPVVMGMTRHETVGMSRVHRAALASKRKLAEAEAMIGGGAKPNVPVEGDVYPVAIMWVYGAIGTPAKQFPIALDTGSFTLDIPMVGCTTCPQAAPNAFYDVSKSSTGAASCPDGCTFSNSYQTCDLSDPSAVCTISGNYYSDVISIGGLKPVPVVFGAINYQTPNFDQFKYICGVVGIAPSGGNQDVFGTIYGAGEVDADVYSMCFVSGSTSNGTFTMGGIDSRLYTGTIQYVPNGGGFGGYNLGVNNMLIGSTDVGPTFQGQSAILDSGTNVLLVTDEQYAAIKAVFMTQCQKTPLQGVCAGLVSNGTTLFDGTCYPISAEQEKAFPTLSFNIAGASGSTALTLTMAPSQYLIYRYYYGDKCLGILPTGSEFAGGLFIVGDTLMEKYLTVFDNTNNQIGWAPVNAQYCGSL